MVKYMETYNDIYLRVRRALRNADISEPEMEAKYIVAKAADRTREKMLAMGSIYATDVSIRRKIDEFLERRLRGEPLAYILGEWDFYGLTVSVNENVLIPRADSEILAAEAIKLIKAKAWKTRILDLCTGSGCIGLAIAKNAPSSHVVMGDNSEDALAVCRQNALSCNLTRNTTVIIADATKSPPTLFGAFDAIVCNPPYIPTGEIETIDSAVRDYEPRAALDGGAEGLDYFHAIAEKWSKIVKQGGNIIFECGIGQSDDVEHIVKQNGFTNIKVIRDTQGIKRVVTGMKA